MDTADYALIVSLFAATIALLSLVWSVWSLYIFPKPRLQVSIGYFVDGNPDASDTLHLISVTVVNHGPNEATVKLIVGRAPKWHSLVTRRFEPFFVKHWGTPSPFFPNPELPKTIGVGEEYVMRFPADVPWFETKEKRSLGVVDTFGNYHWAKRKQLIQAAKSQKKYQK